MGRPPAIPEQARLGNWLSDVRLPGVVADVVIAGDGAERDVEPGVARPGECQVILDIGAVEADVPGVDDEIRLEDGNDAHQRLKVGDKPGPVSTQMGVGDLDNAEGGHARHDSDEP